MKLILIGFKTRFQSMNAPTTEQFFLKPAETSAYIRSQSCPDITEIDEASMESIGYHDVRTVGRKDSVTSRGSIKIVVRGTVPYSPTLLFFAANFQFTTWVFTI